MLGVKIPRPESVDYRVVLLKLGDLV